MKSWAENTDVGPTPIEKRTEPYRDGGEIIIYSTAASKLKPPVEVPLILGDALQDYRAALDHLAWQLVTRKGMPNRPQDVYFPINDDGTKFDADFDRKMPAVSDAVKSIVREHQPYRNGTQAHEHPLWTLHDWNRTDKHRTIPVVLLSPSKINVELPGKYDNFDIWHQEARNQPQPLWQPGVELLRIMGKRRDPTKDHGVLVKIGGEMAVAHESGKNLEVALNLIDGAVDAVLSAFEKLR
jgi:hypothetical protein